MSPSIGRTNQGKLSYTAKVSPPPFSRCVCCVRQSFDDELRCGSHIVRLDGSTRRGALGILTALDTKLARSKARIIPSTGTLAAPLAQGAEVNLVFSESRRLSLRANCQRRSARVLRLGYTFSISLEHPFGPSYFLSLSNAFLFLSLSNDQHKNTHRQSRIYLNTSLSQIDLHSQILASEDVRVVSLCESVLQLFQLNEENCGKH